MMDKTSIFWKAELMVFDPHLPKTNDNILVKLYLVQCPIVWNLAGYEHGLMLATQAGVEYIWRTSVT